MADIEAVEATSEAVAEGVIPTSEPDAAQALADDAAPALTPATAEVVDASVGQSAAEPLVTETMGLAAPGLSDSAPQPDASAASGTAAAAGAISADEVPAKLAELPEGHSLLPASDPATGASTEQAAGEGADASAAEVAAAPGLAAAPASQGQEGVPGLDSTQVCKQSSASAAQTACIYWLLWPALLPDCKSIFFQAFPSIWAYYRNMHLACATYAYLSHPPHL